MKTSTSAFGNLPDGRKVNLYQFETPKGLKVSITNYGAGITSIEMPDKQGNVDEITAGFPTLEGYLGDHPCFGVIVGRFANRIAGGKFRINNVEYHLNQNDGENHLHGGPGGFQFRLWDSKLIENENAAGIELTYHSADLEEGFPGNVKAIVTYMISNDNEITITYQASTDQPTHVNLTNHTYFNLTGFREKIYGHQLMVFSDLYLEMDASNIPTGKLLPCKGSHLDFCAEKPLDGPVKSISSGLDHCFVLNQARNMELPIARLSEPGSGRSITVYTDQPGIQVYSGNSLDGSQKGHNGTVYDKHSAICLETQHYPDSPNQPGFPSTLLKPGEKYDYQARLAFNVDKG